MPVVTKATTTVKLVVLLGLLALAACGANSTKSFSCERPIAGLDAQLGAGRVIWFGEMHGTEESPRFASDAACQAAKQGPVQLGLEIWRDEQPRIDRYLKSRGDKAARDALLAGPFWAQHDGRSSRAMVSLIDRMRVLRGQGAPISIVAYDVIDKPDRDLAMAEAVLAARDPKARFVGLSGNIHSRRAKWHDLVPLVAHLVAKGVTVATHDVSASGGTLWGCVSTDDHEPVCGEHPMGNDDESGAPWSLGAARDDAHDGIYFVGATTAAAPARP